MALYNGITRCLHVLVVIYSCNLSKGSSHSIEEIHGNTPSSNFPVSNAWITHHTGPNRDRFLKSGEVVVIPENKRAIFKCFTFGAKPAAIITWSLSPRRLGPNIMRHHCLPSHHPPGRYDSIGTLTITKASIVGYHNHTLTCHSMGGGKTETSHVKLHILVPLHQPLISGNHRFTVTPESRALTLTCHAMNSFPPAAIDWFLYRDRDSSQYEDSTNHNLVYVNRITDSENRMERNHKINVTNKSSLVVRRNRNGKYDVTSRLILQVDGRYNDNNVSCTARHPSIASSSVRTSRALTLIIKSPPVNLTVKWNNMPIRSGTNLSIPCIAEGAYPRPNGFVYWTKAAPVRRVVGSTGNTSLSLLNFFPVTKKDAGLYTCVVDNGIPPTMSKTTYLNIQYPPVHVHSHYTQTTRNQRGDIHVSCIVEANPAAEILWLSPNFTTKNTTHFQNSGRTTTSQLILYHENLTLARNRLAELIIKCFAKNTVGISSYDIKIEMDDIPPSPNTFKITTDNEQDDHTPSTPHTVKNKAEGTPGAGTTWSLERIFLSLTSTTSILFLLCAMMRVTRRWRRKDKWLAERNAFYVDMSRRAAYQVSEQQGHASSYSPTDSSVFSADGDSRQRAFGGRFFTQQSVENTYDIIPGGGVSPSVFQPRRRRIQSADGAFYDIPPRARGHETVRRVQSRQLPEIPAFFRRVTNSSNASIVSNQPAAQFETLPETHQPDVQDETQPVTQTVTQTGPQTETRVENHSETPACETTYETVRQHVERSVSRDTGEPEIPVLRLQYGGHSENIIREDVKLSRKLHSPARRVFSM